MSSTSLNPTTTPDPLAGHLAHLSNSQNTALDAFKTRLEQAGLYTKATDTSSASHEDVTFVRFLRARKFDVQGAFQQFKTTEAWREKEQVSKLYDEFDVEEFGLASQVYPQYTGRRTLDGSPLYVYKVGNLTKEKVNDYSKKAERLEPRMVVLSEMMTAFTLPLCSALPRPNRETPIDCTISIVDVSSVSLTRFWQLKGHMQRASVMATAHYPETLGAIFLVGAPSFFSTVWSWVNRWFDQGTVDKIFILSQHEVLPTMQKYIAIENIPKRYGGQLEWESGDPVMLDAEQRELLGLEHLPRGPVRFTEKDGFKVVGKGRSEEELALGRKAAAVVGGEEEGTRKQVNGGEKQQQANGVTATASLPAEPTSASPLTSAPSTTVETQLPSESTPSTPQGSTLPPSSADTAPLDANALPAPIAASEPTSTAAPLALPLTNGHAPSTQSETGEGEAGLWAQAREYPAAPIKELAAKIEGTTL